MSSSASRQSALFETAPRLFLVAGLFVLAALAALRVDQFSKNVSTPRIEAASFDERRLTSMLDTVAGTGQSEVRLSLRADDSWSVLVLLNTHADVMLSDEMVGSLIGSAYSLDPLSGDEITVQRVAFARSSMGMLQTQHLIELGLLLLGAGFTLAALFTLRRVQADVGTSRPSKGVLVTERPDDVDPARRHAARAIGADPAGAAKIVRSWLKHGAVDA